MTYCLESVELFAVAHEPEETASRRIPLNAMRRAIIERVVRSKREIPHFYVSQEIDMEAARQVLAEVRQAHPGRRVTLTHLIMKTVVAVLLRHPRLNARLVDEAIEEFPSVHLGFVVGLEDGMLIPVLHHAERMGLLELAEQAAALEARAQARRLVGGDLTGRTFTISSMGMLGVDAFQAVISPPDGAILSVGAVAERAVVRNSSLIVAATMIATLSCDHRIMDGAHAARFMTDLRQSLQGDSPRALLEASSTTFPNGLSPG